MLFLLHVLKNILWIYYTMKFYVNLILVVIATAFLKTVLSSVSHNKIVHINGEGAGGRWTTRTEWKAQWVKEWIPKKIYVTTWKRVWTPVELREWIPLPKPPPGWLPH